jgi:hypothetical protein
MKATLLVIPGLVLAALFISTAPSASSQNANSSTTSADQTDSKNQGKSQGKNQKVIELKANKAPATRGGEADPNIKNDKQTNDPNAKGEPPRSKGGAVTRGVSGCEVRLDNRTNLLIKIYVDGIYRGVLDRYGDGVVYVGAGETHVYARADFDDGTYAYWGQSVYDCGPGQYVYFKMVN